MDLTAFALLVGSSAALIACAGGGSTRESCGASTSQALSVCPGSTVVHGMDVSTYEGQVDWAAAVNNSGIAFAFARVSDGTANPDDQFARNWTVMKTYGVVRGAYQFFRPEVDPTAQAKLFLAALAANGGIGAGDLPPVLDWEVTDNVDTATARANAQTWLDVMEKGTGKKPIIYTAEFMTATVGTGFSGYVLWVANYGVSCPTLPDGWTTWSFWQSTDTGTVSDESGGVDLNEFNGTLAQLREFAGDTGDAGSSADAGPSPHHDAGAAADAGAAESDGGAPSPGSPTSAGDAGNAMGAGQPLDASVTSPSAPGATCGN